VRTKNCASSNRAGKSCAKRGPAGHSRGSVTTSARLALQRRDAFIRHFAVRGDLLSSALLCNCGHFAHFEPDV
jgi:hypothetical protein